MYIKYAKAHKLAYEPERANPSDAGLDVFYSPTDAEIRAYPHGTSLMPNESKLFKTGLKFEVPHGYMLEAKNRSSVASKKQLIVGACVIDSGYSGEVFINLHNIGHKEQRIQQGDKIAQLVLVPVVHAIPQLVDEEELYKDTVTISDRGEGTLGSTDN